MHTEFCSDIHVGAASDTRHYYSYHRKGWLQNLPESQDRVLQSVRSTRPKPSRLTRYLAYLQHAPRDHYQNYRPVRLAHLLRLNYITTSTSRVEFQRIVILERTH